MCKVVRRGYFPSDKKEFADNNLDNSIMQEKTYIIY